MEPSRLHVYQAEVLSIKDGDTIDVRIDQGFGNFKEDRIRFLDLDTAEKYAKTDEEREHAAEASTFLKELLEGKTVWLRTIKQSGVNDNDKMGKYGRILAYVYLEMGDLLSDIRLRGAFTPSVTSTRFSVNAMMTERGFQKRTDYK